MNRARFAVFCLTLAVCVGVAVSTLAAQSSQLEHADRRPGLMMFDGRGMLGITVEDLDAEGLKSAAGATSGVRVGDVHPEGPAAKAGLKEGDIIVEVDGERVRSARQFSRVIQETPESKSVTLGIVRNGTRQSFAVTPHAPAFGIDIGGDRISRDIARSMRHLEPHLRDLEPRLRELEPRLREFEPQLRELEPRLREFGRIPFGFDFDNPSSPRARLGVELDELTPQLAQYFGANDGGVLVSSVIKDSPADKAGLKAGDVITSINGDRVRHRGELLDELRDKTGDVAVGIVRDKKESSLKATIEERETTLRRLRRPA